MHRVYLFGLIMNDWSPENMINTVAFNLFFFVCFYHPFLGISCLSVIPLDHKFFQVKALYFSIHSLFPRYTLES